jgi:two-component system, OmpR family, sensor kinase
VNDLFLLARADSVAHPVQRELLFLEESVTDAVRAGRVLGRESEIAVSVTADLEAPFIGDANLLGRLLLNLVDNAVQYSFPGAEVRVALESQREPHLPDGSRLQGGWYRITVDDDGPGVDPAVRATLFERFVRADRRPATIDQRAITGAGLGLAIVRWVAEVHGGHVWLDATRPRGSRFCVLLPAPRDTGAQLESVATDGVASSVDQRTSIAGRFQNA